ncbi:MAG: DUF885 family protein [Sphingobium sp.]
MNRRDLLIGAMAAIALPKAPTHARPSMPADDALHRLLDAIDPGADPSESHRRLADIDASRLSPSARADLETVLWGLAIDANIARGSAGYGQLFERQFGAPFEPRALHRRFETQAKALARRADSLLRAEGLMHGSVGQRLREFARQPRWLYDDNDAGRVQAVADMSRTLAASRIRLPALVTGLPAEAGDVIVQSLSADDIAAGRQGYRAPPQDGRPGTYHADLREIRRRPRWSLPSVVHHELLPGHFVQQSLQSLATPHPLRLRYAPNFAEGWAIYAEQLSVEAGLLRHDRPAMIGYLQWMLFRISRAAIDTGVHIMGWSVSQAVDFVAELQGDAMIFAPFERDIERIRQNPGGRAAEAMTWLALAEQRDAMVGRERGKRMAAFHHAVLREGAMPFGLLKERLAGAKSGGGGSP